MLDHIAMAEMDAVVGANGHHRAGGRGPIAVLEDLHRGRDYRGTGPTSSAAVAMTTAGLTRPSGRASYTASRRPSAATTAQGPGPPTELGGRENLPVADRHLEFVARDHHGHPWEGVGRRAQQGPRDVIEGHGVGQGEGPDGGAPQMAQVGPAAQRRAEVGGQAADVGPGRAVDGRPEHRTFAVQWALEVEAADRHRPRRSLHLDARPGQLVQPPPSDVHRRDHGRDLRDRARERGRRGLRLVQRHRRHVPPAGHLTAGVQGVGGHAEHDLRLV